MLCHTSTVLPLSTIRHCKVHGVDQVYVTLIPPSDAGKEEDSDDDDDSEDEDMEQLPESSDMQAMLSQFQVGLSCA